MDADDQDIMAMHDHFGEDLEVDASEEEILAMMDEPMAMRDHFGEDLEVDADDQDIMAMHDHMGMHDHFGEDLWLTLMSMTSCYDG